MRGGWHLGSDSACYPQESHILPPFRLALAPELEGGGAWGLLELRNILHVAQRVSMFCHPWSGTLHFIFISFEHLVPLVVKGKRHGAETMVL